MADDNTPIFGGGFRSSKDAAIEQDDLFGPRRPWTHINLYEILFLVIGVSAAIATDILTIMRLAKLTDITDPDFVYGILILVNSVFLLLFLITGIFQQRITDIIAFFVSGVMLTIYVIVHYATRKQGSGPEEETEATIRLIRLICTCLFNVCFIPLSIIVIRDYDREEFAKRLFGAFPVARWPLKIYNIFDCTARINTMLSIATFLLNLYNFNDFESADKVLLGIGIPLTFLWLGVGIGMVRLENIILVGLFCLISCFQPGFIIYSLYSAIDDPPKSSTPIFSSSSTRTMSSTSQMSTLTTISSTLQTTTLTTITATSRTIADTPHLSVEGTLFACIGINLFTHVLSLVLAFACVRNFGKDLKGKLFRNRVDRFFQKRWSTT